MELKTSRAFICVALVLIAMSLASWPSNMPSNQVPIRTLSQHILRFLQIISVTQIPVSLDSTDPHATYPTVASSRPVVRRLAMEVAQLKRRLAQVAAAVARRSTAASSSPAAAKPGMSSQAAADDLTSFFSRLGSGSGGDAQASLASGSAATAAHARRSEPAETAPVPQRTAATAAPPALPASVASAWAQVHIGCEKQVSPGLGVCRALCLAVSASVPGPAASWPVPGPAASRAQGACRERGRAAGWRGASWRGRR